MSDMKIVDQVGHVRAEIAAACARVGRDAADVTLIAVSKLQPPEAIVAAAAAGVQHFGENRVEEASLKIPAVNTQTAEALVWHMIGHVQSRKARDAAPLFDWVQSVDSVKLASKLSAVAAEWGRQLNVLLEINISGEEAKYGLRAAGWSADEAVRRQLWADVAAVLALPGLQVQGLMTMAPVVDDPEMARPVFAGLAALRSALHETFGVPLPHLSMGMTDDYPIAVEEGATMVRIGRAIFGERAK
jgi:pyridoxal phosphate enzyme (YggS family)